MILVISDSKKRAENLSDMFRYMGYLSLGASPDEALKEASSAYKAILILSPSDLPSAEDYISRLRNYSHSSFIFALDNNSAVCTDELFDSVIKKTDYAPRIIDGITSYFESKNERAPGVYSLAGLDLSVDLFTPTYFFTSLPFTKTEIMILRYLTKTYPNPTSAESILKHAYKPSRAPETSNIRTHISVINKKFRKIADRNLIQLTPCKGYSIAATKEELENKIFETV